MQPVLRAIGPKVTYVGAQGLAVQLKVALNMTLVIEVIGFCEGVALAEKGGVPREVAVDAMLEERGRFAGYQLSGAADSGGAHIGRNVRRRQPAAKDMLLALTLGRRIGSAGFLAARRKRNAGRLPRPGPGAPRFCDRDEVYRRLGGMSK